MYFRKRGEERIAIMTRLWLSKSNYYGAYKVSNNVDHYTYFLLLWERKQEKKSRLHSRIKFNESSLHSVQNLSSSCLFSESLKIKNKQTVILRVPLYKDENWSLRLKEEQVLSVSEKRELRRGFGPKREEVAGGLRRLHNDLYTSQNIIMDIKSRMMKFAGHVARMVEMRNMYKILAGKYEGKRPLGRPKHRWTDNTAKYL
jgi:hypothetical protein